VTVVGIGERGGEIPNGLFRTGVIVLLGERVFNVGS